MPEKAWKPCARLFAGCPNLTRATYCDTCEPIYGKAAQDRARGSAASRGYDSRWQKASRAYLREHPFCECPECRAKPEDQRDLSEVVDHITPHRGDKRLFWDKTNWQAMSVIHHNRKTATEDGGFGNRFQKAHR